MKLHWTKAARGQVLPRRPGARKPRLKSPEEYHQQLQAFFSKPQRITANGRNTRPRYRAGEEEWARGQQEVEPEIAALMAAARARIQDLPSQACPEAEGALAIMVGLHAHPAFGSLVDYWCRSWGVVEALRCMIEAWQWGFRFSKDRKALFLTRQPSVVEEFSTELGVWPVRRDFDVEKTSRAQGSWKNWLALRGHLAAASDSEYEEALQIAELARGQESSGLRCALAAVFPDQTEWGVAAARAYIETFGKPWGPAHGQVLLASLQDADLAARLVKAYSCPRGRWNRLGFHRELLATHLDLVGVAAFELLKEIFLAPTLKVGERRMAGQLLTLFQGSQVQEVFEQGRQDQATRELASEYLLAQRPRSQPVEAPRPGGLPAVLADPPWRSTPWEAPRARVELKVGDYAERVLKWERNLWLSKPLRQLNLSELESALLERSEQRVPLYKDDIRHCVLELGNRAIPGLELLTRRDQKLALLGASLLDTPRVVPLMLQLRASPDRDVSGPASEWLESHLEASVVGALPRALDGDRQAIEFLHHLRLLGHDLEVWAERYGEPGLELVRADLLRATAPGRPPSLPSFWCSRRLVLPLLKSGEPIQGEWLERLGEMLAFSPLWPAYPGVAQVKEACEPVSLREFAWSVFEAWLESGGPRKESWALQGLAHFGDDLVVRRLSELMQDWAGQKQHARAVLGLEVLTQIGTDLALTEIFRLSQRIPQKGFREKAGERIQELARRRGLSPDQFADRVVPDLGLGDDGTLELDFGPRQFRVRFDEELRPVLMDLEGLRLGRFPRARSDDDPALAKEASRIWKSLQKEVPAVIALERARLEQAMVAGRSWTPAEFLELFCRHPLLQHLTRRLVWLQENQSFRLAEDGTLADLSEREFGLGAAPVKLAHPLELGDELKGWKEIFGDYGLLQPFPQIERPVFRPTSAQRGARGSRQFAGQTVPGVRFHQFKGWHWQIDGNGLFKLATREVGSGGERIRLEISPGLEPRAFESSPVQTLGRLELDSPLTFGALDPTVFSELWLALHQLARC